MDNEFKQSLKEFTAGCLAGFSQVIVGQPFDLVKVRLQTQNLNQTYSGIFDCVHKTWKHEGIVGFYKGTMYPMLGVGASVAIQFGAEQKITRILRDMFSKDSQLGSQYVFLSGGLAGLVNCSITAPLEHLRIRMQVLTDAGALYIHSSQVFWDIYRNHGVRGVYKGTLITLNRDFFGVGVYFSSYDLCLKLLSDNEDKRAELARWKIAFAGSFAGAMSWLTSYPLDVIKSKIQSDSFSRPQFKGTVDCAVKTFKKEGITGLFQGVSPCVIRAIPVNAVIFLVFEESLKLMGGKEREV